MTTTDFTRPPHRCRRCLRPLDWHSNPDLTGGHWEHPLLHLTNETDHDPDPEPCAEYDPGTLAACDFCSRPGPTWAYPATDFDTEVPTDPQTISAGGWAACDSCHAAIEADDWVGVWANWRDHYHYSKGLAPTMIEALVQELWAKFRAHRVGPAMEVNR